MKKSEFFLKVFLADFIFALLFFGVRIFAGDHGHTMLSKVMTPSSLLAAVICALSLFAALIAAISDLGILTPQLNCDTPSAPADQPSSDAES
jgi:hypothetical protein